MRYACSWLLGPVSILKPGVAYIFTGFAEEEVARAAQSKQEGRGVGQHYNRCYVEPVPLGHLQGDMENDFKISGSYMHWSSAQQGLSSP